MIRLVDKKDFGEIRDMLAVEGYTDDEMDFINCLTVVDDDNGVRGFYSVRMEKGLPYLVHFCTKRGRRAYALAVGLVRAFKRTVKSFGFGRAVIGVPTGNEYLKRLASRYFRTVPYSADAETEYFYVEVGNV